MNKILFKTLFFLIFLIGPAFVFFSPKNKDVAIACMEFFSQSWLLIELALFGLRFKKYRSLDGVQLIPKDMAAFVPITIEVKHKADAILIDDDILVRQSWECMARVK